MLYVDDTLEEIALEGLDGITFSALWQRLANRPKFSLPLDDKSKEFIWRGIARHKELEFFKLPEARPPLVIFDRYEYIDPELGIVVEPAEMPKEIYPIYSINENEIKGSCATYHTRENITAQIKDDNVSPKSLKQIEKTWGSKFVIVSSQQMRWKALGGDKVNPQLELTPQQYLMLERIGRMRYLGEVTLGPLGLGCLKESPKSLHYFRKRLIKEKLITKQMHYQKHQNGQTGSGSLFFLTRFHAKKQTKMELMITKIEEILSTKPNQCEIISKLRTEVGMKETSFKKIFQKQFKSKFCSKTINYREMYPDAEDKLCLTANGKERQVRVIQLVPQEEREVVETEEKGEEDDEAMDPRDLVSPISARNTRGYALIQHAYDLLMVDGTTALMLGKKLNLSKLETRLICRNLERRNKAVGWMQDIGRQRVTKYITPSAADKCDSHKMFIKEKNKIISLTKSLQSSSPTSSSAGHSKVLPSILSQTLLPTNTKFGQRKDTSHITLRLIKRAVMIVDAVKAERLIDDIYFLQKMIMASENKEGYPVKVDKKSMQRLIKKLNQDHLVKSIKIMLRLGDQVKKLQFVCEPNMASDDPLVKSTIDKHRLKSFGLTKDSLKSKFKSETLAQGIKDEADATSESKLIGKTPLTNNMSLETKFGKARILHLFCFYLVYDYKGANLEATHENVPLDYFPESKDWRMFIPPLPQHSSNIKPGWILVNDLILRIPLSILIQIIHVYCQIKGLEDYIQDPIKQHYLVKQLPPKIRNAVFYGRNYIYCIHAVLTKLSYLGMVSFGPQICKEKDQVFIFIHQNLSIKDTSLSGPGYNHISQDVEYPIKKFHLETLETVEEYWLELESICLSTHLGNYSTVEGQNVIIEQANKKPAMIEASLNKKMEEVTDTGITPGDGLGAGGLDSVLYSHLRRNWIGSKNNASFSRAAAKKRSYLDDDYKPSTSGVKKRKLAAKPLVENDENSLLLPSPIMTSQVKVAGKGEKRKLTLNSGSSTPNKKSRTGILVRKIEKKKPKKPLYDEVDKIALKYMFLETRSRVEWSVEEDSYLLLCKVTTLFLQPSARSLVVPFTHIRDMLLKYLPDKAKNKTSRACQRRLNYMLHQKRTVINVRTYLGEAEEDLNLVKKYRGSFNLTKNNEKERADIFSELFDQLLLKFRDGTRNVKGKRIDLDQIGGYVLMPAIQERSTLQIYQEPRNHIDITKAVIHAFIFSAMNADKDLSYTYFQLYKIYKQKYPDLLHKVETNFSKNRVVSKRKQMYKRHLNFLSYHFSFYFDFFLSYKFSPDMYEKILQQMKLIEDSQDKETTFVVPAMITSIQMATMAFYFATGIFSFNIDLPSFKEFKILRRYMRNIKNIECMMNSQNSTFLPTCQTTITIQKSFQQEVNKGLDSTIERLVGRLERTLPLDTDITPTLSDLSKRFDEEEASIVLNIYEFISSKLCLGATYIQLFDSFSPYQAKFNLYLNHLIDYNYIIRTGIEKFRYIAYKHSEPWITSSFKVPVSQTSKAKEIYRHLQHSKIENLEKDEFSTNFSNHCDKVKFVLRVWTKPDGSLNFSALKKILTCLLNFIFINPGASEESLCNRFSTSYQRIQILEILELLEELRCVTTTSFYKQITPAGFFANFTLITADNSSNQQYKFYEAEVDSMLRLAHILDYVSVRF